MLNRSLQVHEFGFIPGQEIADFGVGSGQLSLSIAKLLGKKGRLYAIDRNPAALEHLHALAREQGIRNIDLIKGDLGEVEGTGLKDALVDGVVISNLFRELPDPRTAATEARRILKPRGRIMFLDEKFPQEEVQGLFHELGFELIRKFEMGNLYGLLFAKI